MPLSDALSTRKGGRTVAQPERSDGLTVSEPTKPVEPLGGEIDRMPPPQSGQLGFDHMTQLPLADTEYTEANLRKFLARAAQGATWMGANMNTEEGVAQIPLLVSVLDQTMALLACHRVKFDLRSEG